GFQVARHARAGSCRCLCRTTPEASRSILPMGGLLPRPSETSSCCPSFLPRGARASHDDRARCPDESGRFRKPCSALVPLDGRWLAVFARESSRYRPDRNPTTRWWLAPALTGSRTDWRRSRSAPVRRPTCSLPGGASAVLRLGQHGGYGPAGSG